MSQDQRKTMTIAELMEHGEIALTVIHEYQLHDGREKEITLTVDPETSVGDLVKECIGGCCLWSSLTDRIVVKIDKPKWL